MPTSPLDLTTIALVKGWIALQSNNNDALIQSFITDFSLWCLRIAGRGPIDGSVPAQSPFCSVVAYVESYDGTGTFRQFLRNWPITVLTAVTFHGRSQTIVTPSDTIANGILIDASAKSISIRGGNFSSQRCSPGAFRGGPYGSGAGFPQGVQNIQVSYSAGFSVIPFDLQTMATRVVGLAIKRGAWIGQRSQSLAQGGGTVSYTSAMMDERDQSVLDFYRRAAVV
jgi:hypothetical protein